MVPIKRADVPPAMTTFQYIRSRTGYDEAVKRVTPRVGRRRRLVFDLQAIDIAALRAEIEAAVERLGFRGWRHSGGESRIYGGLSLTCNPRHQDGLDPMASTLGTPRVDADRFFWNSISDHDRLRDSYFDSYGFDTRTGIARAGALGAFIDGFRLSLVRSRIGIIPGAAVDAADPAYLGNEGWHRDEPVFETLRINVPIATDPNFVFQMAGEPPYHLETGKAYSWDTNRPHRVFCRGRTSLMRIHLVIGLAPWFDYLPDADAWTPNRYFGAVHPFDIAAEGLLHPALRLAAAAA